MNEDTVIKQEPQDEYEDENVPSFGPAALGLHRVGTKLPPKPAPSQPIQVLNARGMPARIRKKNRFFFDDDIINAKPPRASPKRGPKASPVKTPNKNAIQKKRKISPTKKYKSKEDEESLNPITQAPDKKLGQKIGMRLRNLLKLPKAHKWVCYEWFYSNLDKTLFDGDNDFMICLKESFPQLKTYMLTRVEWTKIRRMMGKPRRCSEAFFTEERRELERKRQKIRTLQQRKPGDVSNCKDLPNEIPLPLVLGTKVTARLRKPQDGLFTGVIHAVDTSNSTYRITFDRPGLSTYSVPDFEVLAHESPETISLTSIIQKFRPRQMTNSYLSSPSNKLLLSGYPRSDSYPSSPLKDPNMMTEDTLGGFPVKLLENVIRIHKILSIKRLKIKKLGEMNREAERNLSFTGDPPETFRKQYAGILLELEKINKDLKEFLKDVQDMCIEIAPDPGLTSMLVPSYLREKCREEAVKMVRQNNTGTADRVTISNKKYLGVIADLTALMLQIRSLSESDQSPSELQYLKGTIEEIKSKMSSSNKATFRNCIEIHLRHIEEGLRSGYNNQYLNKM